MNGFEGPIHVRRRVSAWLQRGVAVAHLLAAAVAAVCLTAPLCRYFAIALVFINALRCWRRFGRLHEDDVAAVLLDSDDRWHVTLGNGRVLDAHLLGRPFVSLHLVALALRCGDGRRRYVPLVADACSAPGFRRLRVCLLWGRSSRHD